MLLVLRVIKGSARPLFTFILERAHNKLAATDYNLIVANRAQNTHVKEEDDPGSKG